MTAREARAVPWDEIDDRRRDRAAKAPGAPRDLSGCNGPRCSAMIRWAVTETGERMPVDFEPDPAGNLIRVMVAAGDWRIRVLAAGDEPGPGVLRWTSHYATCPDADMFRPRNRRVPAPRRAPTTTAATAPRPGTLLVVDGPSLAHRAWYAYERSKMTTPDGVPIHAVHGFLVLLAGICDRVRPDGLLVGFDDRTRSERRDRYPDYKAGRPEKDPDLHAQMDAIAATLAALGVQVATPAGLEADDVLGSAAAAAETAGWRCVVATSDRDAFGLITDATTVLRLVSGLDNAVPMTPQALLEEYGVTPAQWLDYVALVGDKSDHLDGVRGIGPKTAAKLLAALGSVDAALDDRTATATAVGKAAAATLATDDARAALARNRDIMAIRRDAVQIDVEACRPTSTRDTVATVLRGRHLPGLVDRVAAALCPPAPSSTTRRRGHLAAVPALPPSDPGSTPTAPPLVPADPAPVCPDCGRECAAALPLAQLDDGRAPVLTGEEILVDQAHVSGDLVAVLVDDVWAVRRIPAWEYYVPPENRRRSHACIVYPYECPVPECGQPARLYPAGPRCDGHRPSTPRYADPGQPRDTT